ncbi:MAG: GNAT family N-acetyltransferase [Gammaproteobacteria bacterium]|jgi:ribosomal protein S18 acetylase RimI-like enzyme|nr:GNAT family N-acetyltransferase [Gammaproteobacteria bacterium]MBU2179095.1 GNAT family N-acetyltransferase [Gammaproteobacteria bacterium]MBU2226028.1 GNAT family N-acetyltransferase [Gammaproteobacteria bacterium]MBU2278051.1 GNAT family N-acetyltransferase [Gammaproteobacteria bacterium]MBU2426632.1 GNAT family N-acetyltransferase [Gammaproteobacteria bacterium]
MEFEFQQAKKSDRDYLLALRKLTMVEHLERSGQFLTDIEHEIRLDDKYHCSYLVHYKNTLVGTLKYKSTELEVEIMQVQIHPDHQNKGYGRGIIQQILNSAQSKTVSLTVLKDNPALQLYLRLGFKIVGEDMYEYHMQIKH